MEVSPEEIINDLLDQIRKLLLDNTMLRIALQKTAHLYPSDSVLAEKES